MKKYLTAVLAASVLLLSGCSSTGETVMTFGDSTITENEFQYYLSYYKNIYLNTYSDMEDTAAYYDTVLPDGRTAEEYLFSMTVENVQMTLICMELFDRNGLKISSSMENDIDSYVDSLITDYAGGDKKALNAILAKYGVNVSMLRSLYRNQEKSGFLYDYLYGDNGINTVTEEDKQTWYEENYCRIRHIYVNDAYTYSVDADGYISYDENGNILTQPLTEEEAQSKAALIAAIDEALAAGEDFSDVYTAYSEDQYYPNGYYLTADIDFVPEVVEAAFSLEIGEQMKVVSDVGTHYILRLPLDEGAWADEANADFFADFEEDLKSELFMTYIRSYLPEVEVDEAALAAYTVEASPVNYRF